MKIKHRNKWFYSPEEDAIIREDYANFVDLRVTARKLGRSWGSIRQRLLHHHRDLLNGHRTAFVQRSVNKYGTSILALAELPKEAVLTYKQRRADAFAAAKVAAHNAKTARRNELVRTMLKRIEEGTNRNDAIFEARAGGLPLEIIAQQFGITRERVRQICEQVAFNRVMQAYTPTTTPAT